MSCVFVRGQGVCTLWGLARYAVGLKEVSISTSCGDVCRGVTRDEYVLQWLLILSGPLSLFNDCVVV